VVVWSHSRSRRLLRVPLSEYLEAVAVAGYSEPRALRTCEESLERVGLQSKGELRDHCWELLGWASPYGIPDDAEENAWDAAALCNLGMTTRSFAVSANVAAELRRGRLEKMREQTGAFLELLDTEGGTSLRVVGADDEVVAVHTALDAGH